MRFVDRVVVVTGGGDGIGRATALLMAAEGARVAVVDRDPPTGDAAGREPAWLAIQADVLVPADVARSIDQVVDRFGRIDVLVNGVGGSTVAGHAGAHADELTVDNWERIIAFNLRATFLCTQAVIPIMKRQRAGRIVNISSITARGDDAAVHSNAAYVTAKAGIRALTRKLAHELGPSGITCNATAPGVTLTSRIEREILAHRSPEQQTAMIARIPLGRIATPEDQAKVIAFLASDDAAFVSGQTIEVTGGQ